MSAKKEFDWWDAPAKFVACAEQEDEWVTVYSWPGDARRGKYSSTYCLSSVPFTYALNDKLAWVPVKVLKRLLKPDGPARPTWFTVPEGTILKPLSIYAGNSW